MPTPVASRRRLINKELSVRVFRRDGWICQYCAAPVVFSPALRLLASWLSRQGATSPPAYWDKNWRRDKAPLLDHLGAVVDHRLAHVCGGGIDEENLLTACNKCNIRKSDAPEEVHRQRHPLRKVRAKHGEPTTWDGFSALFVCLARLMPDALTDTERGWLEALDLSALNGDSSGSHRT